MLLSEVEQLLKTWAIDVVRNWLLAEAATSEKAKCIYEAVPDGLRLAMLDVLTLYWGDRRSVEVHYSTIANVIQDEWNAKMDELSREREKMSRRGKKPAPYAEWPLKKGA